VDTIYARMLGWYFSQRPEVNLAWSRVYVVRLINKDDTKKIWGRPKCR